MCIDDLTKEINGRKDNADYGFTRRLDGFIAMVCRRELLMDRLLNKYRSVSFESFVLTSEQD